VGGPELRRIQGRLCHAAGDAVLHRVLQQALFKKAGITTVPTDWTQLLADCKLLKAKGIQPMVYGNGGQAISTEFYPWYDMSYLMIGAHSLASWKDLYDGSIPWTSSTNVAQLKDVGPHSRGWLHELRRLTTRPTSRSSSTVRRHDGRRHVDRSKYTNHGYHVAAFVPPYSNSPIKAWSVSGDGFSSDEVLEE